MKDNEIFLIKGALGRLRTDSAILRFNEILEDPTCTPDKAIEKTEEELALGSQGGWPLGEVIEVVKRLVPPVINNN